MAIKNILCLISIIILVLSFVDCTKKSEKTSKTSLSEKELNTPVQGDWIIRNITEPENLNPITATDAYESRINNFIMETLLERDYKTLKLKPVLADTYFISSDKLEYTFILKKGIKWHNGENLTANDVIYSFNKIKDPKVLASSLRNYYKDVKAAVKIDTYTIKFVCTKKYFLQLSIIGGLPIVCKKIFDNGEDFNKHSANRHPVGTGPYIFEKWVTGQKIVLRRNPDYWKKKPFLNKIVFKFVNDPTISLQMLKRGDLDFTGLLPIQWAKERKSKKFTKKFTKLEFYIPTYSYIGWNSKKSFFNDRRVRTAMTHLLNRKQILEEIYYKYGLITTGPFYVFSDACDSSIKPLKFDINKAKKILDETGWQDTNNNGIIDKNGIEFQFEFLISSGAKTSEQIATIYKENLKKVGIKLVIRKLEWATFLGKIHNKEFDAVILGWSLPWESDPYQLWHSSQAKEKNSSNYVNFINKEADEIIEKARVEFDENKRNKLYRRFHQIIHYEQPYTFLFCPKGLGALDKRFHNINIYKIRPGYDVNEWWVPLKLQKYTN